MIDTLEGTRRFIVTRKTTENPDTFEALPREFRETIAEVHFAEGSDPDRLGQQGSYSIDLDPEWFGKVRAASNLVDVVEVDPRRLGAHASSSDEFGPLTPHLDDVPVMPALNYDPLTGGAQQTVGTPRYWKAGGITNQFGEGACTGHARLNFLTASPLRSFPNLTFAQRNALAHDYYKDNQRNDEWAGEAYEGSSVVAVLKCMIRDGFIKQGAVTTSFEEMVRWKQYKGPLMLETPWYEGMYRTDSRGFIRPTGRQVGWHAILDRGVTEWLTGVLRNSWGLPFGFDGDGYQAEADYRWLISKGLKAYCAVQTA